MSASNFKKAIDIYEFGEMIEIGLLNGMDLAHVPSDIADFLSCCLDPIATKRSTTAELLSVTPYKKRNQTLISDYF